VGHLYFKNCRLCISKYTDYGWWQGPQLSAQRRILSQAAEFGRFRGISTFLQNSVLAIKGDKYDIFWSCSSNHN